MPIILRANQIKIISQVSEYHKESMDHANFRFWVRHTNNSRDAIASINIRTNELSLSRTSIPYLILEINLNKQPEETSFLRQYWSYKKKRYTHYKDKFNSLVPVALQQRCTQHASLLIPQKEKLCNSRPS